MGHCIVTYRLDHIMNDSESESQTCDTHLHYSFLQANIITDHARCRLNLFTTVAPLQDSYLTL